MSDPLELTLYEQQLYNIHLKISKIHRNLPFKYRKDFSSLDDKTKATIKKISIFLQKFKHIKPEEFIVAPYKIYQDEEYFDLQYYTTLKATKAYTLYQTKKLQEDIDSTSQLKSIVDSLQFIQEFCKNNNLQLTDYLTHYTDKLPSFILHLKEHHINLYTLYGFKDFPKIIQKTDFDLLTFILGEDVVNHIDACKSKLFLSKKAYPLITSGLQKIHKNLQNLC